jgi:hypothetical protein
MAGVAEFTRLSLVIGASRIFGAARLAQRSRSDGVDGRMLRLSVLSVTRAPCQPSSRLFGDGPRWAAGHAHH